MMQAGDDDWREHFGRSYEWYAIADLYDALNQNTRATGSWKKGKAPTFDPYPRPSTKKKKKKPKTLADLYGALARPQPESGGLWQK